MPNLAFLLKVGLQIFQFLYAINSSKIPYIVRFEQLFAERMGKELFEDLARFIYQIITRKKSSRSWIS
jgi:hypothetical protein